MAMKDKAATGAAAPPNPAKFKDIQNMLHAPVYRAVTEK